MTDSSDNYSLQIGDYVAPGLYMRYWGAIVRKYGEGKAFSSSALKQYKELRVGAILAAHWSVTTGDKWFVGLPHNEPTDVEVARVAETTMKKSGRETYTPEIIPIQVTRCSATDGEDIVEQIKRKNKTNLSDHTLIVDVTGDGETIDVADIARRLATVQPIHPREIAILATINGPADAPDESTYLQFLLHPSHRSSKISSADETAFFVEPPILNFRRGVSRQVLPGKTVNIRLP